MNILRVSASFLLMSLLAISAFAADAPARRPNVLFIICDDLNARLGCYGDPIVKTPNVDRLAARGVRFDRSYCQYPVCNPSRTSFLSGLYPDTTKVLDQNTLLRAQRDAAVVYLPEHFRQAGYFTAGIGKVEHGGHHEIKWDLAEDFKGAGGADDEADSPRPVRRAARPATRPATRPASRRVRTPTKRPDLLTYEVKRATEDVDPENTDDQIADKVIQVLEQHKDTPFFIAAGFHKPHVPHVAPRRFFDLYPVDKMPVTPVPLGDEQDIPPAALASARNYQPDMSDDRKRDIVSAYYACVSYVDDRIGRVLDALDKNGLAENTIVVFIGDHGWHFGEHNWWAKASLFEESCRAPLILAGPGIKPGVCGRVVEFLDIAPTLTDLCSLPAMPQGQGRSFVPLLNDPSRPWDRFASTALGARGRSICDERYRYTEWDRGNAGVELYDHQIDPGEHKNLAADPGHADEIARMKAALHRIPPTTAPSAK